MQQKKKSKYTQQMTKKLNGWRSRFEAERNEAGRPEATVTADKRERLEASKVAGDAAFAKLAELRAAATRYLRLRREMDELWKAIDDSAVDAMNVPRPIAVAKRRGV